MLITPSFKDYLDYFYNFGLTVDGTVEIITFTSMAIAPVIYGIYLKEKEISLLVKVSLVFYIAN